MGSEYISSQSMYLFPMVSLLFLVLLNSRINQQQQESTISTTQRTHYEESTTIGVIHYSELFFREYLAVLPAP